LGFGIFCLNKVKRDIGRKEGDILKKKEMGLGQNFEEN
jgi:hypothetical protein